MTLDHIRVSPVPSACAKRTNSSSDPLHSRWHIAQRILSVSEPILFDRHSLDRASPFPVASRRKNARQELGHSDLGPSLGHWFLGHRSFPTDKSLLSWSRLLYL